MMGYRRILAPSDGAKRLKVCGEVVYFYRPRGRTPPLLRCTARATLEVAPLSESGSCICVFLLFVLRRI